MVKSGIHGKLSFSCNSRWYTTRWNNFASTSEYDTRWVGTASYLPLPKEGQTREASKSQLYQICRRFLREGTQKSFLSKKSNLSWNNSSENVGYNSQQRKPSSRISNKVLTFLG